MATVSSTQEGLLNQATSSPTAIKPCTSLTPIPLPADDYDRPHSTYAALSSLHAASTSFDAAMAAILSTASQNLSRVKMLEHRIARCREWIRRLDELAAEKVKKTSGGGGDVDDMVCTVFCPSSYEAALEGIELDLADVRDNVEGQSNVSSGVKGVGNKEKAVGNIVTSSHGPDSVSASDAARAAADAAVQHALMVDAQTDDGEAVPSDAWLDHASMGVGLGRALKVAEGQRRMPLLLGSVRGNSAGLDGSCMEEIEYRGILNSLALNASTVNAPENLAGLATMGAGAAGGGDDESVHSATSRMSALSVGSMPMSSGRMTAGQRRRSHQQQQQMRNLKTGAGIVAVDGASSKEAETVDSSGKTGAKATKTVTIGPTTHMVQTPPIPTPYTYSSNNSAAVARRQQSFTGSHPYLCEVLHDSFGIGSEPPKGLLDCSGFSSRGNREGGTEFWPPPSSVSDLLVFNTTRESYGLAKRRAAAAASKNSNTAQSSRGSGKKANGGSEPVKNPAKSATTTTMSMTKRLSGGSIETTSSSLAKLVFVPDASASPESKPTLDLPESLKVD